jgi:NADH-quinone oxidoreductase subunit J
MFSLIAQVQPQVATDTWADVNKISMVFGMLAFFTIFSAIMTVSSKNPVHSVLYLIITFFTLSAHYILLNAQFLAAVNIIVYAGAIMVLFLFVIMFLNLKEEAQEFKKPIVTGTAIVIGTTLGLIIWFLLKSTPSYKVDRYSYDSQHGMVEKLGKVLYSEYLLPFELVSVLFLVAMVGAVMLGKREAGERNF